ncbi:MAG: Hsp70 family protein [Cyanobacteria bacterium]|nr:Hsp70 family protein [Cyanobacteriota bacterium]
MAGTLAIDLGSSSTVVAFQEAGHPARLLTIEPFSLGDPPVVPSVIWLADAEAGQPLIGRQVLEAGLVSQGGAALHRDFKRAIGSREQANPAPAASEMASELTGAAMARAQARPACVLSPEQAGSLLLQRIWRQLPAGIEPERLVLTAPIDGYRGYRRWLADASEALDVAEVALVDEPTAAAIGAGLPPGSRVLVVDLGGGTIDLSLVALEGGEGRPAPIAQLLRFAGRDLDHSRQALRIAKVLGKAGLALGGRDIDQWIAEALCPGQANNPGLLEVVERMKCSLSSQEEVLGLWRPGPGPTQELRLNRTQLDRLLQEKGLEELLDQLLEAVLASARAQGVALKDVDAILPVGGTSRLPSVRRWLQTRCAGVPLRDQRPIEAVALGALGLTPGVTIQDLLSHGLSLRCWDRRSSEHRWHPLFSAGQGWPSERPFELVLACSQEGQRSLELVLGEPRPDQRSEVVFEGGLPRLRRRPAGEAPVDPWPQPPAPVLLDPPGQAGVDRLKLRFSIESTGTLLLEGEDLLTGAPLAARRLGQVR